MPCYRALTTFSLEQQPICDGDPLPQELVDEPGNQYQLDQLLETGTTVRLPDPDEDQLAAPSAPAPGPP